MWGDKIKNIHVILSCLLLECCLAGALTLYQHIDVHGNGTMEVRTDLTEAQARARGVGEQTYDRYAQSEEDRLFLNVSYHLKTPVPKSTSYYSIREAGRMTGLLHAASIYGDSSRMDVTSKIGLGLGEEGKCNNSPIIKTNMLSTNYSIAGNGKLVEAIADRRSSLHPEYLTETSISGPFELNSSMNETVDLGTDFERASKKLPVDKKNEGGKNADNSNNQAIGHGQANVSPEGAIGAWPVKPHLKPMTQYSD